MASTQIIDPLTPATSTKPQRAAASVKGAPTVWQDVFVRPSQVARAHIENDDENDDEDDASDSGSDSGSDNASDAGSEVATGTHDQSAQPDDELVYSTWHDQFTTLKLGRVKIGNASMLDLIISACAELERHKTNDKPFSKRFWPLVCNFLPGLEDFYEFVTTVDERDLSFGSAKFATKLRSMRFVKDNFVALRNFAKFEDGASEHERKAAIQVAHDKGVEDANKNLDTADIVLITKAIEQRLAYFLDSVCTQRVDKSDDNKKSKRPSDEKTVRPVSGPLAWTTNSLCNTFGTYIGDDIAFFAEFLNLCTVILGDFTRPNPIRLHSLLIDAKQNAAAQKRAAFAAQTPRNYGQVDKKGSRPQTQSKSKARLDQGKAQQESHAQSSAATHSPRRSQAVPKQRMERVRIIDADGFEQFVTRPVENSTAPATA